MGMLTKHLILLASLGCNEAVVDSCTRNILCLTIYGVNLMDLNKGTCHHLPLGRAHNARLLKYDWSCNLRSVNCFTK